MLAIIIIVALFVIFVPMKGTTLDSTCVSQNNCPLGFVCDQIGTGGTGICKAGFGTNCGSNGDCFDSLVCINGICVAFATTGTTGTGGTAGVSVPVIMAANPPTPAANVTVPMTRAIAPLIIPVVPEITRTVIPTASIISRTPELVILPPTPQIHIPMPELVTIPDSQPIQLIQKPVSLTQPSQSTRVVITNRSSKIEGITPLTDIIAPRATTQIGLGATRAVLPQTRRPAEDEVTSLDDEINSDGRTRDGAFDIHSGVSTDPESDSVSTPYEERAGAYYCRTSILPSATGHATVIDVCSYSNAVIFLLEDGNIISELSGPNLTKRHRVTNNVLLTRVTSFNGYLYGVGADGKVYTLPNTYFSTTNWVWSLADWAPTGINQISSTYDGAYLWIQTTATGYLYNKPGALSITLPYAGKKRVYGKDMYHYLDINQTASSAVTQPVGTIIHDIYDGALSYYDEVIVIRPSERNQYRRIVIINWKPYYVQK